MPGKTPLRIFLIVVIGLMLRIGRLRREYVRRVRWFGALSFTIDRNSKTIAQAANAVLFPAVLTAGLLS
ncbi:hypothetical protein AS026_37725 [Rhizobium altiplani]|uniref:Uncharacterized protein n=1 Tax=Rhizobium altiplani TaxID=1864509 RepID=A0A109JUD2_9HYPH|nr:MULTISPECIES: hypothetical protein [Rhizobium]KWV55300.1 hypothetical protein AS026_37725 [Rhizobium altiplani]